MVLSLLYAMLLSLLVSSPSRALQRAKSRIHHHRGSPLFSTNAATGQGHAPDDLLQSLASQATLWCALHGLLYRQPGPVAAPTWAAAPVSLLPEPYPVDAFDYVTKVQPLVNELVDKIARDRPFIVESLSKAASADPFTARLLRLYQALPEEQVTSSVQLGILRSDYMLDRDPASGAQRPLQVEVNTIASSFGCLSARVGDLHRHMLDTIATRGSAAAAQLLQEVGLSSDAYLADPALLKQRSPPNLSIRMLAFALAMGHFVYGRPAGSTVVFLVQEGERNAADQRLLEHELFSSHGVRAEFLTFRQMQAAAYTAPASAGDGKGAQLRVRIGAEDLEVTVVYFRSGYGPDDYKSEADWVLRELIERSAAIKCPSVGYQLAGTKKVQQLLCGAGGVERFVGEEKGLLLRRSFAAQFGLGDSAEEVAAAAAAVADGSRWVVKPQREGGGNNLYGADVSSFLRSRPEAAAGAYVLMQRIFPQPHVSYFLRDGLLQRASAVSELGVYGSFIGDGSDDVVLNSCCGYLLRVKSEGTDEGGVATGYSVLGSVVLDGDIEDAAEVAPGDDDVARSIDRVKEILDRGAYRR